MAIFYFDLTVFPANAFRRRRVCTKNHRCTALLQLHLSIPPIFPLTRIPYLARQRTGSSPLCTVSPVSTWVLVQLVFRVRATLGVLGILISRFSFALPCLVHRPMESSLVIRQKRNHRPLFPRYLTTIAILSFFLSFFFFFFLLRSKWTEKWNKNVLPLAS